MLFIKYLVYFLAHSGLEFNFYSVTMIVKHKQVISSLWF